jgi:hypothetical protein
MYAVSVPQAPSAVTAYRCVDYTGAQLATQGAKVMGVAQRAALAGDGYEAGVIGSTLVEAAGAIPIGSSVISDNQGRAMVSTGKLAVAAGATPVTSGAANGTAVLSGGDTPEFIFGDALSAATQAGDLIEVLIRR